MPSHKSVILRSALEGASRRTHGGNAATADEPMRAFVLREHGPAGARLEEDFPDPVPGEGDVVLRVRATSLNYHDVFTRRGMPGIRIAKPEIMGLDVAGEIAAI